MNNKNLAAKNSSYSSSVLYPNYITGFIDAEGSFGISIYRKKECKTGWNISPSFQIGLHMKDLPLLHKIKSYFGVGHIYLDTSRKMAFFAVNSTQDLIKVIIPHFDKYPLLTQKRADFELFKLVLELISKKEHLTIKGLAKVISIRASMNLGLSNVLKIAFPDTIPVDRPKVEVPTSIDPIWLLGFIDGEGNFFVEILKSKNSKLGIAVSTRFSLVQHIRDHLLMDKIKNQLNCGKLTVTFKNSQVQYRINKLLDIDKILIPLFNKYPLQGVKRLDYTDFVKIVELMKNKAHLTKEGLDQIREIKAGMNTGRDHT
jgi:hypothetical protein